MTPDALRAAIASARLRPRMYAQTGEHLASMLYGMVAGAAPDGVDVGPAWGDAYSPANVHAPTDAEVCDAAEATVSALWPQGDAPAGDECAAYSAAPLDTPMPPAFVAALASLSPAEAGALDLDAIEASIERRRRRCDRCHAPACATCDAGGDCSAVRCASHTDDGTGRCEHTWLPIDFDAEDQLTALVARVRELEAQLAAAQPAVALDALRNGRFTAHCCACSAEWPLGVRDCPGCGHPDRDAGAVPDRDLCPHCGALDLDHVCAKSASTVAGEAFATEHPYAAAGIMGSATAREGKG